MANQAKILNDKQQRQFARNERDSQWEFMERVEREGVVWMCPWDKYHRHGTDGVYVYGLLGSNEFLYWLNSHKEWWKRGRWSAKRCASSIRITDAGRAALKNRDLYDMEPIHGGMMEPGYIVTPLPREPRAGATHWDQS
jgi:hypothetical protein